MYIQYGLAVNSVTPISSVAGDHFRKLSRGGVYRPADGGNVWMISLPDANIKALLVQPVTPTLVLAEDREGGLYRTADGGDSWMSTNM